MNNMFSKAIAFLKKPVFVSERSRRILTFLKRSLLICLAVALSIVVLPQGFFMLMARIDTFDEIRRITEMDVIIGPLISLIIILIVHEYLPRTKIRRYALIGYVIGAIFISLFFLWIHISQVAVRSSESPFKVIHDVLRGYTQKD